MLFLSQATAQVSAALAAALGEAAVAVVGMPRLGRALAAHLRPSGRLVITVALSARGLRRLDGPALACEVGKLPIASGALGALVGVDVARTESWEALIEEWIRTVKPGGTVILVDRGPPAEISRRALCAGLTDLEQRAAGRTVVTSGTVRS